MRKQAAFLVVMLTLGLVFAGAVSAQDEEPTIDVAVMDENLDNVTEACVGDEVTVGVMASANEETIEDPMALIRIDPESGLTLDAANAVMWTGTQWINNVYNNEFLFWSEADGAWMWGIFGMNMEPGDVRILLVPAVVTDKGPITVTADLYENEDQYREWEASGEYEFWGVPCGPCHHCHGGPCHGKVPMQNTGTPLALAALGLLGVIGGTVYSRIR